MTRVYGPRSRRVVIPKDDLDWPLAPIDMKGRCMVCHLLEPHVCLEPLDKRNGRRGSPDPVLRGWK